MNDASTCSSAFAADVMAARVIAYADEKPPLSCKGLPPSFPGRFADLGTAGFFLGDEKLPMPVALLRESSMRANSAWMGRFLNLTGLSIAPHGKTVMSPEIFRVQMEDGAWGLTAGTPQQAAFCVELGVRRLLLANQLVGAGNIGLVLDLVERYPDLGFYCLVDSSANADELAAAVKARGLRPLNLLVEIGLTGGRTGTRTVPEAMELARHVARLRPYLALAGVEAYEGVIEGATEEERGEKVTRLMQRVCEVATACDADDLFGTDEIILTAGGSEFFDLVGVGLSAWETRRPRRVVIRSGCYIVHDSIAYEKAFDHLVARSDAVRDVGYRLQPALEVWAAVQSRPEPELAFATLGKRDVSHDWDLPKPLKWLRPCAMQAPETLPDGHSVVRLNDQHAHVKIPAASPLQVGDLVGFGISHVCTTFDKWRCVLVVDDYYRVTGAVRTFF